MSRPGLLPKSEDSAPPAFVLPPWQTSAWVVETEPTEAGAWLAALPLADSVQSAQQIYQALFTLNRMPLEADDRLVLMELYRKPVAAGAGGIAFPFGAFSPASQAASEATGRLSLPAAYGNGARL